MPNLRTLLLSAAFLALACGARAATPSRYEVLRAIAVLEKSVTGQEAADAAKVVVIYAQDSDDVMVDIGPEQLPWVDEKWGLDNERELACKSILLAAFVAGNIQSQIKNSRAEDDTYSGWVFAIGAYDRLRAKGAFRSESIDRLAKMEADGTLLQHARDVRQKEDQMEKQDQDDPPKAPMAVDRHRTRSAA